jgi:hypothetical protein
MTPERLAELRKANVLLRLSPEYPLRLRSQNIDLDEVNHLLDAAEAAERDKLAVELLFRFHRLNAAHNVPDLPSDYMQLAADVKNFLTPPKKGA